MLLALKTPRELVLRQLHFAGLRALRILYAWASLTPHFEMDRIIRGSGSGGKCSIIEVPTAFSTCCSHWVIIHVLKSCTAVGGRSRWRIPGEWIGERNTSFRTQTRRSSGIHLSSQPDRCLLPRCRGHTRRGPYLFGFSSSYKRHKVLYSRYGIRLSPDGPNSREMDCGFSGRGCRPGENGP